MKNCITDNNRWLGSENNKPVRDDGSVVNEGDDDAIANPDFGTTTEVDCPDPPKDSAPSASQPTKSELLAKIQELLTAVNALKD